MDKRIPKIFSDADGRSYRLANFYEAEPQLVADSLNEDGGLQPGDPGYVTAAKVLHDRQALAEIQAEYP
jgi:hypothetical protein